MFVMKCCAVNLTDKKIWREAWVALMWISVRNLLDRFLFYVSLSSFLSGTLLASMLVFLCVVQIRGEEVIPIEINNPTRAEKNIPTRETNLWFIILEPYSFQLSLPTKPGRQSQKANSLNTTSTLRHKKSLRLSGFILMPTSIYFRRSLPIPSISTEKKWNRRERDVRSGKRNINELSFSYTPKKNPNVMRDTIHFWLEVSHSKTQRIKK